MIALRLMEGMGQIVTGLVLIEVKLGEEEELRVKKPKFVRTKKRKTRKSVLRALMQFSRSSLLGTFGQSLRISLDP